MIVFAKNRLLLTTLFVMVSSVTVFAQGSVEILEEFKKIEGSSVLALYKSEFKVEIDSMSNNGRFDFVVIRMLLEGDVAEAKKKVTLRCNTVDLERTYKDRPNEMLFLFPREAKTLWLDCGDGCDSKNVVTGRTLSSNTVYKVKIRYTAPKSADADKLVKVAIKYNNKDERVAYRENLENEKVNYMNISRSADSLSLRLGKSYDFFFSREGYEPIYQTYKIGDIDYIEVPKFENQIKGEVKVKSRPKGAKIFYKIKDSKYSSETDNGVTPHTLELPIGDYEIFVQHKDFYVAESQNVSVKEGKSESLMFKLKEKVYFRTFILLTGAYSPSNQWSGGVMVGMVKHAGWYVKFRSSFDFAHFNKFVATCDKNGYVNEDMIFYSGKTSKPYINATAGLTVRLGCPLTMYLGAGYGNRQVLWETSDGKWVKNNDFSYHGVAADCGLLYNTKSHVSIMAGVNTINFKYLEFEIGLGYVF